MSEISEILEVTEELVRALERLVRQLSRTAAAPTAGELGEIVSSPTCTLLAARLDGHIVGSLTLVSFRIPTGLRARIEDVVVDETVRGRGIGRALVEEAIRRAAASGADAVELTSRPARVEANRLYRTLGFELRETNVYRYRL